MKRKCLWIFWVICMLFLVMPVFGGGGGGQQGRESKPNLLVWLPPFASGDTLDTG
jgi:hypothetical protein